MTRDEVISGLKKCAASECNEKCPYNGINYGCRPRLMLDAVELLKEQATEIERLKRPDCEHAEHDGLGCLGYSGCKQDDEPIEACKLCEQYTGNRAYGAMIMEKDCFTCANSFVDDDDKLHCMADGHNHEQTVDDNHVCDDWKR